MFIVHFPGCAVFMFMTYSWMGLSCCPYLYITHYCSTGSASSSDNDKLTLIDLNYILNIPCNEDADNSYQYCPMR